MEIFRFTFSFKRFSLHKKRQFQCADNFDNILQFRFISQNVDEQFFALII